ncbi:MAG: magnesium transporter [Thermoleophilia bacterium]|nr:magnesium transporter [Thermoleophilia bacterium]
MEDEEAREILQTRIEELIGQRRWADLRMSLSELADPEIVDLLLEIEKPDRVLVFRLLPRQRASEVFSDMDTEDQNSLLKDLTNEETRQLLANLRPDDRTSLFEELPGQATQKLLNLLSPEDLHEARQLLGYPEDSVGRLMTPDYVAVRADWTIEKALDHIRIKGLDSETINIVYVIDSNWKLLDALGLRRFILADPQDTVEQIMDYTFVSLSAFDDREKAVEVIQKYDIVALPVVGSDGTLLGIVTVDDVMDVAQEEATEDFHKSAAVAPLRVSYRESSVGSLYRKRVGWLVVLVFVNLASSGIIAAYETMLASTIALAFFIPLLIDSGGNTGAQSATLMVRALATGDVRLGQWGRTLLKEIFVGAFLGVTMGLASSVLGLFRGGLEIGVIVGLTMVSIVLMTNIIGIALPFVLTRLRLDPAVASSPLITSVSDALGLILYFSIATAVLNVLGPA